MDDDGPVRVGEVQELPVELIDRNPGQPRHRFDRDRLAALAASLDSTNGVLQPIIVRPRDGARYELIAGERRWRASVIAGRPTVRAIIRDVEDDAAYELAAIENMVREDLSPVEEARCVAALCETHGLSKAEIGRRVGRTREAISNLVRLLELPDDVLDLVDAGQLSEGHGRALLMCSGDARRRRLARLAVAEGWSVRRLERAARTEASSSIEVQAHPDQLAFTRALSDALQRALGRDVQVVPCPGGYRVALEVRDFDDADRLLELVGASMEPF
jgi:ParB family transcriptional regulator, chromosome partitioning protein